MSARTAFYKLAGWLLDLHRPRARWIGSRLILKKGPAEPWSDGKPVYRKRWP